MTTRATDMLIWFAVSRAIGAVAGVIAAVLIVLAWRAHQLAVRDRDQV